MPPSRDPRYPAAARPAGELGPSRGRPRPALPFRLDPGIRQVCLLCTQPLDHFIRFAELFRLAEELKEKAPGAAVHLWLRSDLADASPFALLPVDRIERMPEPADAAGRGRFLARLAGRESACILLGPSRAWEAALQSQSGVRLLGRTAWSWRAPAHESLPARLAGRVFFQALERESPRWIAAPDARPPALDRGRELSFLVHQARFHVGDTLWLTPLLRAIRRLYPRARTTIVGPPVASTLLAGNPHVAEVIPSAAGKGEERRRVLDALAGRRFDAALFAFARRPESRWLAQAAAAAGVPWRINLEYFDPALDNRRVPPWLTHEGWCFWGALPSPRMLLHALDPLLGRRGDWTEADRRLDLHVPAAARERAAELLAARGLADGPFAILAPGGLSSRRWPAERFARLAARLAGDLGLHVLIEGSPAEEPLLARVAARAVARDRRIVAAADPLPIFAALIERTCLLVANDSAPIHLAAAVGTPCLYFAQREKLVHSHPAGDRCRALYEEAENDPRRITVGQALGAVKGLLKAGGKSENRV